MGNVRIFFEFTLFLLIGVACGTASRWELFGKDGTHWVGFFAFDSLYMEN